MIILEDEINIINSYYIIQDLIHSNDWLATSIRASTGEV